MDSIMDGLLTEAGIDMVSHPEGITLYSANDELSLPLFMCNSKKEAKAYILGLLSGRKGR